MTVYLDLVFLLNFTVDLLLLLGTNRISGFHGRWLSSLAGAVLGGLYGCACLLPGFHFLGSGLWRAVFLLLIGCIAFGWNRNAWRRIPVFVILSMALGGIASGIRLGAMEALVLGGGVLWVLCRGAISDGTEKREYLPAELTFGDRTVRLFALRDTGNTLRDPVSGEQVLVCGADVGEELLGISRGEFQNPVEAVGKVPGLRLIPYHAVGTPHGMMLAVRLNKAMIGNVERKPLVAFAPEEIAKGQVYRMLTGGTI